MSGEHDTPIGTPVVIAPGKIFLVGEYAVLDEGCAVLTAITRYAKAQFMPRMDSMPPLVTELVGRTKADLGEAAAALPPGAVFVNTDDFKLGCAAGGLGSSAAIAVATVGAVYESLGLAVEERRLHISAIADGGRRATQGDVGSGADTAAATYGGLIGITRHKDALPRIDCLAPPAGLHLALFSAGRSISTRQMAAGLREYAKQEPAAFAHAMATLREIAHRFVAEVTAGDATGAVVAAGKYGDALAKLTVAASVPIMTDAFVHASNLAQAFGGIAKPTGAGGGEIGVAMFATPEAARLFKKACVDPLTPLEGDIEPLGVRCRDPEKIANDTDSDREFLSTPSPEPFEVALPPVRETTHIEWPEEEANTVLEERVPVIEAPTLGHPARPRTQILRKRILPAAAIILAVTVTWFTFSRLIGARGHAAPPPPRASEGASSPIALPLPEKTAPPRESAALPEGAGMPATKIQTQGSHEDARQPAAALKNSHASKVEPRRHASGAPGPRASTVPGPAAPARAKKPSALRAGNLSPDDF